MAHWNGSRSSEESDADAGYNGVLVYCSDFWDVIVEYPPVMPETGVDQDQHYDNWDSSDDNEETMIQKEEGTYVAAGGVGAGVANVGVADAGVVQAAFLFANGDDDDDDDAAGYWGDDDEAWSVNGEV